jgi:hypothetical protein
MPTDTVVGKGVQRRPKLKVFAAVLVYVAGGDYGLIEHGAGDQDRVVRVALLQLDSHQSGADVVAQLFAPSMPTADPRA